jgi:Flp pilus assembly protein TadG
MLPIQLQPRRVNRQSGVATIELALILPLLLVLSMIVVDVGRALMQYNTLAKSVRDAVRYLSMQTPGTGIDSARNLVVYGNLSGTGAPVVPGLSRSHVPTPAWQVSGSAPVINTVTVAVTGYTFRSMFGTAFGVNFADFTFNDISATMRTAL